MEACQHFLIMGGDGWRKWRTSRRFMENIGLPQENGLQKLQTFPCHHSTLPHVCVIVHAESTTEALDRRHLIQVLNSGTI